MTRPDDTSRSEPQQIAVWLFVGATFLFAWPALFQTDPSLWVRIVFLAAGFLAIVAGGIQLGRELRQRHRPDDSDPTRLAPNAPDDTPL